MRLLPACGEGFRRLSLALAWALLAAGIISGIQRGWDDWPDAFRCNSYHDLVATREQSAIGVAARKAAKDPDEYAGMTDEALGQSIIRSDAMCPAYPRLSVVGWWFVYLAGLALLLYLTLLVVRGIGWVAAGFFT